MKVYEMWENNLPSSKSQDKINKAQKRLALTHELKMLYNRQRILYTYLKNAGEILAPQDIKDDDIQITTIPNINLPLNFFVRYTDENRKLERIFDKMFQRARKLKLLLIQSGSVE